ncbi:MAG: HlyD family secretion protein [Helicobacteraceae bacterium 4484_230]|nr:MAG: HlyD family secretion protein [Helicobacteraceae bacterium 4484_230]
MKLLFFWLIAAAVLLNAREYYAKVEPYETLTISSNVSGLVVFADEKLEGKVLGKKPYILIDDELDQVELKNIVKKIELLNGTLALNKTMSKNYEDILKKKRRNYENIKSLKTKSVIEKDREFYDLVGTQNQSISIRKEIQNLKTQINDLGLRKAQLERSIKDKFFSADGYVLYRLIVKEGQVVNRSAPLAEIADVRKAKLTLYLSGEDMKDVQQKSVYINGKKSGYKINRLWEIADSQHLSSYRAEIIIDAPKRFSQLVKVEFKSE